MAKQSASALSVETLTHDDATRKNIATAEYQSVMQKDERSPVRVGHSCRYRHLTLQQVSQGMEEAS